MKASETRGLAADHIAMMPLRCNVPKPAADDWTLKTCPKCGRECWYQEKKMDMARRIFPRISALCTECALKAGVGA